MEGQIYTETDTLASYAAGPDRLEAAIAGLSEDKLDLALSPRSWSIRQIVHHLADGDDIWKVFVKRAIGNPQGLFELAWYWEIPQDEWVSHWAYAQRAIEPSLALFRANHKHVVQLLESIPGAWEKCLPIRFLSGTQQSISVAEVMDMQARHVEGHIDEICKIREKHGV